MARDLGLDASATVVARLAGLLMLALPLVWCSRLGASDADVALLQRECSAGSGARCTQLGAMYDRGDGVRQDRTKGATFYRLGCDRGDSWGCVNLGLSLETGIGVRQDVNAAERLYRRACEAGNADGCFKLGALHDEMGPPTARNPGDALHYYGRACTGGVAEGCTQLAELYRGRGGHLARPPAEAALLFGEACTRGHAVACLRLAELYQLHEVEVPEGTSPGAMVEGAVRQLDGQCTSGEAGSCLLLGLLYDQGGPVRRDRAQANTYYGKSCKLGNEAACAWGGRKGE